MNLLTTIKNAFIKPDTLESKAIVGVDGLGRTNPVQSYTIVNNAPVSWQPLNSSQLGSTVSTIINAIQITASQIDVAAYSLNKDNISEKLANSPLGNLLYRPNPNQSAKSFNKQCIRTLLAKGNVFIWIVKGVSKPVNLYILPDNVEILATNQIVNVVTGYRIALATGGYQNFAVDEIIHIKYNDAVDALYSESPLQACIKELTTQAYALAQRAQQMQNGGVKTALFEDGDNVSELTPEQKQLILNKLNRTGEISYFNFKVGKVEIGLNPVELNILESLKADAATIAGVFNYPSQMLPNSEGNTFNNVGEARKAYYTDCVLPILDTIIDALNNKLGKYWNDSVFIAADTSSIDVLKPNLSELITAANNAPFLTVNEKRKLAQAPALKVGGDGFLLPINISYKATIDAEDLPTAGVDTYDENDNEIIDG